MQSDWLKVNSATYPWWTISNQSVNVVNTHTCYTNSSFKMYGDASSAKFARARRNFAKSLAGYSIVTFLLQIKDRHNGNILMDRDGHLIHIDFGFMLSNTPGNIGFEAAPFKLPPEYIEVLGGTTGASFLEFRRLFREGFEAARKHCDRIISEFSLSLSLMSSPPFLFCWWAKTTTWIALVELMQKHSTLPCFALYGEQTAHHLRDRFQPTLTHSLIGEYVDRLIDTSLGSNWTRLYDSVRFFFFFFPFEGKVMVRWLGLLVSILFAIYPVVYQHILRFFFSFSFRMMLKHVKIFSYDTICEVIDFVTEMCIVSCCWYNESSS